MKGALKSQGPLKSEKCDHRRVSEMQCDQDSILVACFEGEGRGSSTKEYKGLWKLGLQLTANKKTGTLVLQL